MDRSIDIQGLRREAEQALQDHSRGVTGEWSAASGKGTVYRGAIFRFGDRKWVVVRGPQRPDAAQLLDATAWLKNAEGTAQAVALLDPEATPQHDAAPSPFRRRYQAAAWDGLGIVALETGGPEPWTWAPAAPHERGDIDELAAKIEKSIAGSKDQRWVDIVRDGHSPPAEPLVCKAVKSALGDRFREAPTTERGFDSFWRRAKADGLWIRDGEAPGSVALEVKVSEDKHAPFCQAFDDLGKFDAVFYVRLASEQTLTELGRLPGLRELKGEVQRRLPVRFIDVQF